jgi:hypothetical protein
MALMLLLLLPATCTGSSEVGVLIFLWHNSDAFPFAASHLSG